MEEEERLDELFYELEYLQTVEIGSHDITRVPGGWLFRSITKHSHLLSSSESMVFVPYKPVVIDLGPDIKTYEYTDAK